MMKDWVKRTLVGSGTLRLAAKVKSPSVAVLFYHSVMDDPSPYQSSLGEIVHSTQVFREQLESLARHYSPVSLGDVLDFVRDGRDLPPRPVVVTFDDGYKDNFEVAAPVMNHFGVPGVFYITVDCIDNQRLPWPARLRFAIYTTKKNSLECQSLLFPLRSAEQRTEAFLKLSDLCAPLAGEAQEEFIKALEKQLEVDSAAIEERLLMTWDEVRHLASSGHEIGSHTMTHPNIAYVRESEMQVELSESKRRLEQELKQAIIHFAYPGPALRPNWNQRSREITREVGYQTATTIEHGPVRKQDDPLTMKRIGPGPTVQAMRWNLDCTFLGRKV